MKRNFVLVILLVAFSLAFAQKDNNGIESHCDPDFTGSDIGTSMMQPNGSGQVVSADCSAIGGCDDYFDIMMQAGDTVLASFCQGGGGASWDTGLSVWSGAGFSVQEDCNDDTCGLQSEVSFTAASTGTYRVRVGGFGGSSGVYDLFVVADPTSEIIGAAGGVPTLGQWGMISFLATIAVAAVWVMRRNRLA